MNKIKNNDYFNYIHFVGFLYLFVYFVLSDISNIMQAGLKIFLLACFILCSILHDYHISRFPVFLGAAMVICIFLIALYGLPYLLLVPFIILDWVVFLKLPTSSYLLPFCGLLVLSGLLFDGRYMNGNLAQLYTLLCFFTCGLYFMQYEVMESYKKYVEKQEEEESQLIKRMDEKDSRFRFELERNSLYLENQILEEKGRISQVLHDKLGHSVNGSLYQLEACKVLLDTKPEESRVIMQGVIDNLRVSMDEIRAILRREKPDRKRMALLQLMALCNDCEKKYSINAQVNLDGENEDVPEIIWETILDNSFEAISNALKYARCRNIMIDINILNKVVRCSIKDDGIGCISYEDGMGIAGMRERVRKLNGSIALDCVGGFSINMLLPFEHSRNHKGKELA